MTIVNIKPYLSSFSCFDWKEGTIARERLSPNTGDIEPTKKVVFTADESSHYLAGDNPETLRIKFIEVFLGALAGIPVARLPLRCFFLLTGSWAIAGYEKAKKVWMQQCVKCDREGQTPPKPLAFYPIATVSIASELTKGVVKCATLPLAMIGLIFAALWGEVNPYDGRKLVATIEDLWSIEIPKWADKGWVARATNFMAICMQDIESWKKKNLFRIFPDYNPHTLRGILLSLKTLHVEDLGHIHDFNQKFTAWRTAVEECSPADSSETNLDGSLNHTPRETEIKDALLALLNASNALNNRIVAAVRNKEPIEQTLQQAIDDAAAELDQVLAIQQ